jgi:Zn-dependent metalloprotease
VRLTGAWDKRLRACLACGTASVGAAIVAIVLSLLALSVIVLALGAGGVGGFAASGHPLRVALEDGAVAFYLAQLVSVSFFNHSAELRFAALPGLALVAAAIATSGMLAVRLIGGSARKRMLVAVLTAIPYALLAGLGTHFLALRVTGPYIGKDTAMAPASIEAFVLPLVWGLLFAPVGGLVGVFGRRWREEANRLLGGWAIPARGTLRALAVGLSLASVATIVGGAALLARSSAFRLIAGGSTGHVVAMLGGALIALPTLVLGVFLSCFGVSFDWRVEALSRTQGSGSILGGMLPSIGAPAHGAPAALAVMLVLATATVVCSGWMTTRRSGGDVSLGMVNALRAGLLMTLVCWLFGLLTRVDAQAGGYLGLHLQASAGSLLWRAPLWCLLGSVTGGAAFIVTRGASSRRELAAALQVGALRCVSLRARGGGLGPRRWELVPPVALSAGFLLLPATLVAMGPAASATATSSQPTVSLAPIRQAAEQGLRRDAVARSQLSVTIDPNTRVADSAIAQIPVSTLGVAVSQSPVVKAQAVLARYGKLFGASGHSSELGQPEVMADPITKTRSHVYFAQTVDGVPVFGSTIGVHFSPEGKDVEFINGSFLPDVTLANTKPTLSGARAVAIAKTMLPAGKLVRAPRLEIYAGPLSHEYGPSARLGWFIWLAAGPQNASSEYVVDATTGSILHVFAKSFYTTQPDVEAYDAEEKTELPGKLAETSEKESSVKEVKEAYTDVKEAWEFFDNLKGESLHWSGYDGKGDKPEKVTVLYGNPFNGAEWYPPLQDIVLGKGYPRALDVVGHEYNAAVAEQGGGYDVYEGESGAVAEGFSDFMGEALESYKKTKNKEVEEPGSKWEYGKKVEGKGPFRNLKAPKTIEFEVKEKTYPYPEKRSEYYVDCQDNGGVHENSTIISHALYELATKTTVEEAANIAFYTQMVEFHTLSLTGSKLEFENVEKDAVAAAKAYGSLLYKKAKEAERAEKIATLVKETESAFKVAELDGVTPMPTSNKIGCEAECTFQDALMAQQPAHGTASTLEMLATLYRARGALADTSVAGRHFMPLYEEHMGRITELVSLDPTLAETAVNSLAEIAPSLNALAEGKGKKYKLSKSEMAKIEAALKRLAQDDRLISGGGSLAALIERELKWLNLQSYAGMTYATGFARLNAEVKPATSSPLIDPNCSGNPYPNNFQINGFTVNTPGHHKPGEVSPLVSAGVVCGAVVERESTTSCHDKAGPVNEKLSLELPPGARVESTKEMESGAYIGKTSGRVIACAGEHSKVVYGETGITAVKSWTSAECPTAATACFRVESTFSEGAIHGEGHGYGWVAEEGAERLVFTTGATHDTVEDGPERLENVPVSFGQFKTELCARAGKPSTATCGGSSAPWVFKTGEESQPGCPTSYGLYVAKATNAAKETTAAAQSCVYWGEHDHKQLIDSGKSLSAVSCVPESTDCVAVDSSGNALYSTNVSATAAATWTSWTGPTSPSRGVSCPSTALCAFGDGKVTEGGGGNMYYATAFGGAWAEAFTPAHGVLAVSCPSASFCVDGQESGRIRYSTKPASTEWTEVTVGSGAMNSVDCLSASFCAAVNGSGDLYVANTETGIKEASGWKSTDIDGSTALQGVSCSSIAMCVAVDSAGDVISLAINSSGEAKEHVKRDIDGANSVTGVSCVESGICTAVDSKGNVFVSNTSGATWNVQYALGTDLTSVSCTSGALCVGADTGGHVTSFSPQSIAPSNTQTIDSGNALNAVSCIPSTAECVAADSKGNELYNSEISDSASGTWKSWTGPTKPAEAISCPASTLCALADGEVEAGSPGGNVYYATSVGGAWTEAFGPAFGVIALSCPTSSFCVDGQEGGGFIRYSTKPASGEWSSLTIGSEAMNGVYCRSASFCAVVDSTGHLHVATSEAKIKEGAGWKSTDIDGTTALYGVACTSTTTCFAVDHAGNMIEATINGSGEATATTKEDIDGTNAFTAVTCTEGVECAAVDSKGNIFTWNAADSSWKKEYMLGTDLTSVSCSTKTFCLAAATTGEIVAFTPESE